PVSPSRSSSVVPAGRARISCPWTTPTRSSEPAPRNVAHRTADTLSPRRGGEIRDPRIAEPRSPIAWFRGGSSVKLPCKPPIRSPHRRTMTTDHPTDGRPAHREPKAHPAPQAFRYPLEQEFVEPHWTRLPGFRDVTRDQWESA